MNGSQQIIRLAKQSGILRPRDLLRLNLAPHNLNALANNGLLVRLGRGLYALPNLEWSENHSLAEVAKSVPAGVICLVSALRFHEIGTQSPSEVWIALERDKGRPPRAKSVHIRTIKLSPELFESGIETHNIEGVPVRIYGIAKTVVDCWRFRNRIGTDVAIEALRDVLQRRLAPLDELRSFAKEARVWNVMRPYIEAML